ncbi:MAG: hypothetical protein JKX82_13050, partial [Oleispira sp.]|nr:hypothetical protein [Oleispira sp.]
MPNTNDRTDKFQDINSCQTTYSRLSIIKAFTQLCGLTNLKNDVSEKTTITKPSLLTSSSENDSDPSNRFSFFCANPSASQVFYDSNTLHEWQSQLLTSSKHQNQPTDIPFHSGWLGYFSYPNSIKSTNKVPVNKALAELNYYPWVICFD